MGDFNSSLPVRTQTNGDVVSKLCDGTTNTQILAITSAGRIGTHIRDPTTDSQVMEVLAAKNACVSVRDGANLMDVDGAGRTGTHIHDATTDAQTLKVDAAGRIMTTLFSGDSAAWNMGQQEMDDSMPVVIASDQSVLNVNVVSSTSANPIHLQDDDVVTAGDDVDILTYTATAAFKLELVQGSASGKAKFEVLTGTIGSEVLQAVGFNSTANPNVELNFPNELVVADGDNVLVHATNRDNQDQTIYAYINGYLA
jgi:hypothetical protein